MTEVKCHPGPHNCHPGLDPGSRSLRFSAATTEWTGSRIVVRDDRRGDWIPHRVRDDKYQVRDGEYQVRDGEYQVRDDSQYDSVATAKYVMGPSHAGAMATPLGWRGYHAALC
jgi:hypothetical protein